METPLPRQFKKQLPFQPGTVCTEFEAALQKRAPVSLRVCTDQLHFKSFSFLLQTSEKHWITHLMFNWCIDYIDKSTHLLNVFVLSINYPKKQHQ